MKAGNQLSDSVSFIRYYINNYEDVKQNNAMISQFNPIAITIVT